MTEHVSADAAADDRAEAPPTIRERPSLRRGIIDDWWVFAVRGVLAILFGLAALIWPDITVLALVFLFGAYALVDGIFAVVMGMAGTETIRWWTVVWGLVSVAAGIAVFLWPGTTALVLVYVIAAWAILTGASQIAAAIAWRREMRNEWLLIVAGVLTVLVGIALAVFPGAGALSMIWLIGALAIVAGVILIVVAFRLRELRHRFGSSLEMN